QGIVNEGETKEPSVNITSNDAIIIREDQGIVNEGETKEPSVNTTNNDAIIIREDQGIVNEGETKEPSVNTTSNDAIINQENSAINKTSESTDIVGGLLRNIGQLWFIVVPVDVTIIECKLASYFLPIANVIYKSALVAFLLWRLRQIENIKLDICVGSILFVGRLLFHLAPPIIGIESNVNYDVGNKSFRCSSDIEHNKVSIIGALVFEFAIYLFVTFRLVKILIRANKYSILMNNTRNSKGSLFTTVMYWNFIRVFLAIISDTIVLSYTLLGFYEDNDLDHAFIEGNIQTVLYICLSYFITADVEIVKVVKGRKNVPSDSTRIDTSTKGSMSEISGSNLASNQSLESVQFTSELSESEEKISSDIIDEGKIAIVSMKKLSFTECANLVMDGIKNDDTDGGELYEGKKIEVINEEVTDNNFSGTTLMTLRTTRTLNDELDV
ncbi:4688_t:CDS:2, partial [Entrophospora sp. SA101]